MIEIDTKVTFEKWIKEGAKYKAAIQGLNIKEYKNDIIAINSFEGSLFLGCTLTNKSAGNIVQKGGLVIKNREEVLFQIHRSKLYSPKELFDGFDITNEDAYKLTYDNIVYDEYVANGMENPTSILISLSRRLHDHSITDALEEIILGRKVVAIMGGHAMERKDPFYLKIAKIARTLTKKGFLMVSGGGPGAMEATHLGAYFSTKSEKELEEAIALLKVRPPNAKPNEEYKDKDWLHRAWSVMEAYTIPKGREKESMSIGIPTWLYGHEPPSPFATHIAKYFANSVREDGLLSIAKHGVIYAPGSAGTTQEIFQDVTKNHYAPINDKKKFKRYVSPMILFGTEHWTKKRPLWDFMKKVSKGKPYGELLHLTEDKDKIIDIIVKYKPEEFGYPKEEKANTTI